MWYVFSPRLLPPSQSCFLWPQQSRFGSALPSRRAQAEKSSSKMNLNWILKGRLCFTLKATFELLPHLCDSWELPNGGQDQPAAYVDHTNLGGLSENRLFFVLFADFQIRSENRLIFFYFQINFQSSPHSQPGSLCRKSSLDWIHPERKEPWLEIKTHYIVPGK